MELRKGSSRQRAARLQTAQHRHTVNGLLDPITKFHWHPHNHRYILSMILKRVNGTVCHPPHRLLFWQI